MAVAVAAAAALRARCSSATSWAAQEGGTTLDQLQALDPLALMLGDTTKAADCLPRARGARPVLLISAKYVSHAERSEQQRHSY
jgi:hypothetical protein